MTAPHRFRVGTGAGSYDVLVGPGLLDRVGELVAEVVATDRWGIVSDSNVAPLYAARVAGALARVGPPADVFTFPAGAASKTREEWSRLSDALVDAGYGRDSALVALGGGVTGDLAGFVAATFMRGIPVVQMPTSLLAMVDASVGGKTGVDVPGGKNLVGAFHAPARVVTDPEMARTEPAEGRVDGLVEAVKHGAIVSPEYFDTVERASAAVIRGDPVAIERVVLGSVEIKSRIVEQDERESGLRQILNFGHTIGHGIEAASDFGVSHGAAVATGMVLEARLGERLGVTREGTAEWLVRAVTALGRRPVLPPGLAADRVLGFIRRDKKGRGGSPRFVLLDELGRVADAEGWTHEVSEDEVRAVLSASRDTEQTKL